MNRRSLECPIYLLLYDNNGNYPVALLCGHSFCSSCSKRYPNNAGNCPICRKEFHFPEGFTKHVTLLECINRLNEGDNPDLTDNRKAMEHMQRSATSYIASQMHLIKDLADRLTTVENENEITKYTLRKVENENASLKRKISNLENLLKLQNKFKIKMQKEETVPKALKWLENDLGSIARYIWLNVKDKFQREIHLRALLGDAYAQIQDEIENDLPCSVQDVSIREMSASAYGRELYNAQMFLLKNVEKLVKNQQIQEERTERALSLLMERQMDHEQAILEIKSTVENMAHEQRKFFHENKENQSETTQKSQKIIEEIRANRQGIAELHDISIKTEQDQRKLSAAIQQVQADIRQKTDAITEKLETDSQTVAELKAVTIAAEQEQKSLSAEVMRIQESLNGIIKNTSEMKGKLDLIVSVEIGENARKFEKFIGRWKLVKRETNGVERNISNYIIQSYSFELVPEGVIWKQYRKDGPERYSWIFTTDKEIENKLEKEGKRCDHVELQRDGSFKDGAWRFNVQDNRLIERWFGNVFTFEKC